MTKKRALALLYVVCSALVVALVVRHLRVAHFLAGLGDEIFPHISVGGVPVGGLTRPQAEQALQAAAGLERRTIGFFYEGRLLHSLPLTEFGAAYDFSALVEAAHQHGRTGSRRQRYAAIQALEAQPHEVEGRPLFRYDEALVPIRLDAVRAQASILPVNATMRWNDDATFDITEGTPGRTPDMQHATAQVRRILAAHPAENNRVELQMQAIAPRYTAAHFQRAQSPIGTFTTPYYGEDDQPRNVNIRLAASQLHNQLLFPSETFSTRKAIGPSTAERGYALATVIVDGQLVEDYGGGVCQVASTLYNAVLFAEQPVLERTNHSLRVHYLDFGFDAAIAGDYMDLKFQNATDYPILLVSLARGGFLHITLYGHEARPPNRSIAFESTLLEVIPPEPPKILFDEDLPSGHVLVNTEPQDGFKYALYKIIFVDGEKTGQEQVNTSKYRAVQGVITKGPQIADKPSQRDAEGGVPYDNH